MDTFSTVTFSNGSTANIARIQHAVELPDALHCLGLQTSRPVLVVVGGAGELRHYHIARLHALFLQVLVPLAETLGAIVVDGGTDTGVMQLMGRARCKAQATFPLVGVAPAGMVAFPDQPSPSVDAAELEPNHTHFVLIPASLPTAVAQWGDESGWLAQTATTLADHAPSVTVLINGGEVTWQDAAESVQAGRPIVAIAGSGRAADTLASALHGTITDERAAQIAATGLLSVIDLEQPAALAHTVREILSSRGEAWQRQTHTASF